MHSIPNFEAKKEERLFHILSMVNDWLKFAEAKHAILIAFNGASIYGLVNVIDMAWLNDNPFFKPYLMFVIIVLAITVVVGVLSFIPQLKFIHFNSSSSENQKSSIYFGHLKDKSAISIIQGIYETSEEKFSSLELDIAHQIQQNSTIASNKFDLFTVAAWLTIIAYVNILAFILGVILWAIRNNQVK